MSARPAVLLIHGFLEDRSMWIPLLDPLKKTYEFIVPELPGHGSQPAGPESLADFARGVKEELERHEASDYFVIGHSMGGYVACELSELIPGRIRGLCLFHSSAAADTEEKKINRLRAIELAKENKPLFVRQLITSLYSPSHRDEHHEAIEEQVRIGQSMTTEGITRSLQAMKDRRDSISMLRQRPFPLYYFLGDSDPRLPLDQMKTEVAALPGAILQIASDTGHMGHIECPGEVRGFFQRILRAHG